MLSSNPNPTCYKPNELGQELPNTERRVSKMIQWEIKLVGKIGQSVGVLQPIPAERYSRRTFIGSDHVIG